MTNGMTPQQEWTAIRTALGAMKLETTLEAAKRVTRERDALDVELRELTAAVETRMAADAAPQSIVDMTWKELAAEHLALTGEPPPWDEDYENRRVRLEEAVTLLRAARRS